MPFKPGSQLVTKGLKTDGFGFHRRLWKSITNLTVESRVKINCLFLVYARRLQKTHEPRHRHDSRSKGRRYTNLKQPRSRLLVHGPRYSLLRPKITESNILKQCRFVVSSGSVCVPSVYRLRAIVDRVEEIIEFDQGTRATRATRLVFCCLEASRCQETSVYARCCSCGWSSLFLFPLFERSLITARSPARWLESTPRGPATESQVSTWLWSTTPVWIGRRRRMLLFQPRPSVHQGFVWEVILLLLPYILDSLPSYTSFQVNFRGSLFTVRGTDSNGTFHFCCVSSFI